MKSIVQQNYQIIDRLTKKTWGRGWVILEVNTNWRNSHFTRFTREKYANY